MTSLLLALAAFILLHSVPAIRPLRASLVSTFGRRTYLIGYSVVSLATLLWVFQAAFTVDYIPLWDFQPWHAVAPIVLSPIALWLVFAGLMSPNPLSVSIRNDVQPGAITCVTRHPVLWGFLLWSGSHVLANGDLRSLILFGGLALFSAFGIWISEKRSRRRLGTEWASASRGTAIIPFAAILAGRARLTVDAPMLVAAIIAALLTLFLLTGGHAMLFGADPIASLG